MWQTAVLEPQFMLTGETTWRHVRIAYSTTGINSFLDNCWSWGIDYYQHVHIAAYDTGYIFSILDIAKFIQFPYSQPSNMTGNNVSLWDANYDSIPPLGGGCPTLYIWNGATYNNFGVINIHNPENYDLIKEVYVLADNVGINNYQAKFRLREGVKGLNYSHSEIDQVKLYAIINGSRYLCPLICANHSTLGNVWLKLLLSDDWKVDTYLLETIDLKFYIAYQNVTDFIFVIGRTKSIQSIAIDT
ncbi:MAG: hypothetical protein ACQXXH_01470 [Candidatus Bathyarchaeia archaeon]|jgi:hypothetical protein|nr:hypothetical protein [Candidatus Bathyarchaeota archaeon A05DMB-4]MDH7596096.1 hypothetical protein [Candidatus Bathyarchaeota archaeon]